LVFQTEVLMMVVGAAVAVAVAVAVAMAIAVVLVVALSMVVALSAVRLIFVATSAAEVPMGVALRWYRQIKHRTAKRLQSRLRSAEARWPLPPLHLGPEEHQQH
jgi:hypothetical protein